MFFTVKGKVQGKARPRVTARNGFAHAYTPKNTKDYEKAIRSAYIASGGKKYTEALEVVIYTYRPLPKSRPKKIITELDTCKPDVDNIAKVVLDALNGVAYDDDKQIISLAVFKMPRTRDIEERIEVFIEPIKQDEIIDSE